ncbi:MAG: metalloprotease TldD, partial [Rhodobacteraceae bacterium]|nr:metalloprotease TldD [Paracoccaceae bacterium]
MHAGKFDPFATKLDRDAALRHLQAATDGADDGELFMENSRSEVLSFDDGRLRTASFNASEGFGLRAVLGETSAYAHGTEISETALARALGTARLALGNGGGVMADAPARTNRHLYRDFDPLTEVDFASKVAVLRAVDSFARDADPRVVQVTASLAASLQQVAILRPDGMLLTDSRPMTRLNVSVILEENGRRESGTSGAGGRRPLSLLTDPAHWQGAVTEAIRIARVNLGAEPAPAGIMDVVLGPGWPGILLHEAVGHGLEGDFNRKKSSAFSGRLGERVASPGVTVVDDG